MSLLSVVCVEMGLDVDTSPFENKKILPETWDDFLYMDAKQLKQCQQEILKQLNVDSNTVDRIWFNMHYLSLYNHFNIKDNIQHNINNDILSAFTTLLSRHAAIIKNATFVIRMEWSDIAIKLNAKKKKHRPESPWGVIPSLSIPADPTQFQEYIWPNIPFQLVCLSTETKQHLSNNADKIVVVYLKALDLAAIAVYGLCRKDENDKWLIRYYQQYGHVICKHNKHNKQQQDQHNHKNSNIKYCNLKTCLSYHRICILMHLHGKWTENEIIMQKSEQKSDDFDDDKDDVSDEKGIRLQKYVSGYLSEDFDAEVALNDIYHLQEKHIDFWVTIDDQKQVEKDGDEFEESLYRYQDIKLFCDDMNETRAEFCGEFVCGMMKSSDIKQLENDQQNAKNDKIKMKHPTLLPAPQENKNKKNNSYNDINELCFNLHKNIFHGYSLFDALKQYRVKAAKMNPDRIKKKRSAIRLEMQQRMREKMQQKLRQKTFSYPK